MRRAHKWRGFLIFLLLLSFVMGFTGCATTLSQSHENKKDVIPASRQGGNNDDTKTIPAATRHRRPPFPVRGIYVTSNVARSQRLEKLIKLVEDTELNAMVIDINGTTSLINLPPSSPKPSNSRSAKLFRHTVKRLKDKHIYLIARIVTFKNPAVTRAMPAWALQRKDGGVWTDRGGDAWVDPYREEAWAYPIALAKEALRIGFDEVQFDYVRFPENRPKVDREVSFHNPNGWSRNEAIGRFLHKAAYQVHKSGGIISADVFGLIGTTREDMGIGQRWATIATEVDVISPMVYPSHYSSGIWGIRHPDLMAGSVVAHAMKDANLQNGRLREAGRNTAEVRPWLQSFTASWVHPHQSYGPAQIREQVRAASRQGVDSYLLWNASSRYPNFGK
ncbi:putative glycoside hydrolase [Cohnella sp. AR92]|uniref:putative glycoside hydrolase n=1 Tax=Cohnella sp. AR92 TaxID=648716 RepID=UPI000F8D6A52|nr:putative glycoside hydrolase [Cohnella sp. AR92]RUS47513.1 GTP-binding protein [Cohnella sp. AR92]